MGVLDNPDLVNDSSVLLSADLLDSHVGGVGKIKPGVTVVRRPECGPVRAILVEVVVFLSAARRAWAVRGLETSQRILQLSIVTRSVS